jgi:adenine phosphoribosyltransferase
MMSASAAPASLLHQLNLTPQAALERLAQAVRNVPDYPKPGILFKDITTVIRDAELFKLALELMAESLAPLQPQYVVGIEARGFIFGAALADRLNAGFVPVRKQGKLPGATHSYAYALEYGIDRIEIHEGAIEAGASVVVVDDLLATGGTAAAAAQLLKQLEAKVLAYSFFIELDFLQGRKALDSSIAIHSLLHM